MLAKKITYTNFNDEEVTETFYFNLSKAELIEMQFTTAGGLKERLESIVESKDRKLIMETFKDIIMRSYGEKSPDGKYLDKGENMSLAKRFVNTAAYDVLIMELFSDEKAAAKFFSAIIPKDLAAQAEEAKGIELKDHLPAQK